MGMDTGSLMGLGLGAGLGALMASRQKTPAMPAMPAPSPVPQASQAPDTQTVLQQMAGTGQAGGAPGISQTFLTGAGGVAPDKVATMRNKLYGSGS